MKFSHYILASLLVFGLFSCKKNKENSKYEKADFTTNWKKAWGTSVAEDFAGAVIDPTGSLYFTGSSQPDGYLADIFLTKVNLNTQSVIWSILLDAGDRDFFPSPSENGHSQGGGGAKCIAIDANNDVYIAGASKNGFNETFIMKINGSGTVVWQRFWKAADNSLANSSTKAYALDVKGNKVFVTGSTGAGIGTEEAMPFLLVLNTNDGTIVDNATRLGFDISTGYNDRGYTIKSFDGNIVYVAGWEGANNSGFVTKFTASGETHEWTKRYNLGIASRFTDIDFDAAGNVYLGVDYRGVSTFIGVVKLNANGDVMWSKKYQGVSNDRNNISCVKVISNSLYVGGKGSFEDFDESQFGDACLLKFDLNGNLLKEYNFFTGEISDEKCGERIESIIPYNGNIYLLGETWPEYSAIDGHWYIPKGNVTNTTPTVTFVTPSFVTGNGFFSSSVMNQTSLNHNLFDLSAGGKGSADVVLFSIKV